MSELDNEHLRLLEAVLFASNEAMSEKALANRLPDGADLKGLLKELKDTYSTRGVQLVKAGKTWAFRTAQDLSGKLSKEVEVKRKMSRAAIETLAIVAYHQPVTRAEIEEIRGVSLSKGTLDHLFELGWTRPRGRRETPGRPMTWGTSDAFLAHFGLEDIKDLPGLEDLEASGLLNARPAIEAYRTGLGEGGEVEPLGGLPLEDEGELPEPLDPEDGEDAEFAEIDEEPEMAEEAEEPEAPEEAEEPEMAEAHKPGQSA